MLNMDFRKTLAIETDSMPWEASPSPSVFRKRLAREERESGHATSLVKYTSNASFHSHPHPKGEEILVLDGIFSDETGDYPAGTYIRNPPGSTHAAFSVNGCVLFVKLDQFQTGDNKTVSQNTMESDRSVEILHQYKNETTCLIQLENGSKFQLDDATTGVEVLVISGSVSINNQLLSQHGWFRGIQDNLEMAACSISTRLLLKTGHLTHSE
ncbi:hypothetical protein EOPP23_02785 [Endozoicomonas sp. OPT23]|uniref:cupin domain-containing protein n=1 Tax=Endozoicomonas sp. OPT23 TaxID=2072845 RepID=UPI00129A4DFF|nr:cupin domain-containing protein [Endozoicomonas sp. OPT23]MRI31923.1 hypothetical protein [Endozoicomonas sp. OPT23]